MIYRFRALLREQIFGSLLLLSCFCTFLYLVRGYFSPKDFYFFLNWNLFLAWIPYGLGILILYAQQRGGGLKVLAPLLAAWFFFFPNAPYIVTDFLHLRARPPVFFWFDIALLTAFALTGLFLGFASLAGLQEWITQKKGRFWGWLFAGMIWIFSSFGIYLGRFLRWNSWNLLTHPVKILSDAWVRILSPNDYPGMFLFCAVYSALLLIFYQLFWNLFSKGRR